MNDKKVESMKSFQPCPSFGWFWLVLLAGIVLAVGIVPVLAMDVPSNSIVLTLVICIPIGLACLALAFWFPTMRYELDQDYPTLLYGPVLKYRIPLRAIRKIRHGNLNMTIWLTIRFPGIALFTVPYGDVGNVKMCATAALSEILLIETEKE